MPIERPLLTARWTELVMLSFAVPPRVVAQLAPAGTAVDLYQGQAYASVIGFLFRDATFLGFRPPGHRRFEEVNLRFYVTREIDDLGAGSGDPHTTRSGVPRSTSIDDIGAGSGDPRTTCCCAPVSPSYARVSRPRMQRRGVVFVREIAPRPIVAAVARWAYNESYVTRRMRSEVMSPLRAGSRVAYQWQTGRWLGRRWNRVAARAAADPQLPEPGSLDEFIVEHYWAYVRGRDGTTWEYRVAHRPWRIAPASDVVWDCDLAATYGDSPLTPYLAAPPASAFIADGSPVQVFRGRRIDTQCCTPLEVSALDERVAVRDALVPDQVLPT